MLRHHRNVHGGGSRIGGGESGEGGGGESRRGRESRRGGGGRDEGKSIDRKSLLFCHPFTANITGPTGCGKTYFVKELLQSCRTKIAPPPQRIVWLYKRWQPLYGIIGSKAKSCCNGVQHHFLRVRWL